MEGDDPPNTQTDAKCSEIRNQKSFLLFLRHLACLADESALFNISRKLSRFEVMR
jgi:hypothetical protein